MTTVSTNSRRSRLALLLLLAAACSAKVDPIPDGGIVTCSSSGECPSGHVCSTALRRCIRASNDDRQPPGIVPGSASARPAAARASTLVTVTFDVDEDLASDPEVRFSGAAAALGATHRSGRTYTVAFPASPDDGAGAHPIVARLVDLVGNVTESAPVATVTFDFTPPSATAPAVAPAFARSGDTLTATMTFSEPLDGAPTLAIVGGPTLSASTGPGANDWTFTWTLDGSEPPGLVDLLLTTRDVAGNELVRRYTGAAALDFSAPTVETATIHTPSLRSGDTFVAEVRFNEPLASPPALTLVPTGGGPATAVTASAIDARTYALSLSVPLGAADGERELRLVSAQDRAGNPAAPATLGTCTLDSSEPTLQGLAPDHANRLYRETSPVAVSFSTSEDLAAPPDVRLETSPLALAMPCVETAARSFTCTSLPLGGTERPESVVNVSVTVRDAAGNVAVGGTSVVLDFTPPTLVSAGPGRPAFPANGTVSYAVAVSEPLDVPPALVVSTAGAVVPGFFGAPASASATSFTWSRPVPTGVDGAYAVAVALVDEAGNAAAPAAGAGFAVDTAAPSVEGASTLSPAKAAHRAGDTPALTFTASEVLPTPPQARLATATPVDAPCVLSTPPRTYTCTLARPLVATDLPEGANAFLVTLTDAASNVGYHSRAVTLDYTRPTYAGTPATQLIPGPGNLRSTITALGGGGSVFRLSIISTEPLAATPAVVAKDAANGFERELVSVNASGASYVYELTTDDVAYPAAIWTITWDPVDLAGNRWPADALPQIATVAVDGTPPPAPDVGPASAPLVVWDRRPWGDDATMSPYYAVTGGAAAVPDANLAIVWDGGGATAFEVGRAEIGAAGFVLALGSDPTDLWLSTLDRAGNQSGRTRIVDVAWTAALNGKVPASTYENPHRFETRTFSTGALRQGDALEVAGSALNVTGDGRRMTTSAGSTYRRLGNAAPAQRARHSTAFDAARGKLVVFGGYFTDTGGAGDDVWEWDAGGWRQISPLDPEGDGNPPFLLRSPAVFDPIQGGIVTYSNGLWLWTGASWKRLDRLNEGPWGTSYAAAAWDAGRNVLVLLGGTFRSHDTWEWNGSSWRNATPIAPGDSPPDSVRHAMVYDPVRRRVVTLGGNATSDLWTWTGTRWEKLVCAGTAPPPRRSHELAWDPVRGELVTHGGWLGDEYDWAPESWDGRTFVLRTVAGVPTWVDATPASGPLSPSYAGSGWDPAGRRFLLVRLPFSPTPGATEVRVWGGSTERTWNLLAIADPEGDGEPAPPGVQDGAVAFNAARNVTVYHRGFSRETWEWNGLSWARGADATALAMPDQRRRFAVGSYGAGVILFGGMPGGGAGALGDTWSWNGTTWQEVIPSPDPASDPEAVRYGMALVEDPDQGRLFRFGGCGWDPALGPVCFPDLWEWTGAAWNKLGGEPWDDPEEDGSPSADDANWADWPSVRAIWDRARGSLVFSRDASHVYWEWRRDSASWSRHDLSPQWPQQPEPIRFLFYDPTVGTPVALADNGAWQVDLTANVYRPMPSANVDGLQTAPTLGFLAYQPTLGKALIVAGPPVTWEAGSAGGPAHLLHVDFRRANGPDPAACVEAAPCPIQSIEVRWAAGGSGPTGDGGKLHAWTGEWSLGVPFAAPASTPATAAWSWTPASQVLASSLFHGPSRELSLAITPNSATTAFGRAQVTTDAVAVTVRYRRP